LHTVDPVFFDQVVNIFDVLDEGVLCNECVLFYTRAAFV
jgi:hypothetical protein